MRSLKTEELELVAGGVPGEGGLHTQSTKNNGLGNLNQGAPGGSLPNNGAENNLSNPTLVDGVGNGNPPGSGNFPVVPN